MDMEETKKKKSVDKKKSSAEQS